MGLNASCRRRTIRSCSLCVRASQKRMRGAARCSLAGARRARHCSRCLLQWRPAQAVGVRAARFARCWGIGVAIGDAGAAAGAAWGAVAAEPPPPPPSPEFVVPPEVRSTQRGLRSPKPAGRRWPLARSSLRSSGLVRRGRHLGQTRKGGWPMTMRSQQSERPSSLIPNGQLLPTLSAEPFASVIGGDPTGKGPIEIK